jgi:hypothetical protein
VATGATDLDHPDSWVFSTCSGQYSGGQALLDAMPAPSRRMAAGTGGCPRAGDTKTAAPVSH